MNDFSGCKMAYIVHPPHCQPAADGPLLLVYLRDNYAEIPFPGQWDFPGGGREGDESPEICVLRELHEEFGLNLPASRLLYKQQVINQTQTGHAYFFVVLGSMSEICSIQFGHEGQYWRLMPMTEYFTHPEAIPSLVERLQSYLASLNN